MTAALLQEVAHLSRSLVFLVLGSVIRQICCSFRREGRRGMSVIGKSGTRIRESGQVRLGAMGVWEAW
uniref:Putative secreted peptide n=1 Tax=Anopheles braziliensis TaxID=58242 RepID=A0A2M3ZRH8_9DIPT